MKKFDVVIFHGLSDALMNKCVFKIKGKICFYGESNKKKKCISCLCLKIIKVEKNNYFA